MNTQTKMPHSIAKRGIIVLLSLFFFTSHIVLAQQSSAGNKNLERQGRYFISIVYDTKTFSKDLLITTYVNKLSEKLAKNAQLDYKYMRYYVIEDPAINAFAAPGATFFINTGIIETAENEGELASILAHELAHHKQNHLARLHQDVRSSQVKSLLALVVGLAVGGEDGIALAAAGQAAGIESVIDYTLEYEQEADAVGLRILLASDYHPVHAINFMKKLERSIRSQGLVQSNIHNTHPVTQERIASFEARASRYRNNPDNFSNDDFLFVQARTKVVHNWQTNRTIEVFKQEISKTDGIEKQANQYGYALALAKSGDVGAARMQIQALLNQNPNNQWLLLAAAEIEIDHQNPEKAVEILQELASSENLGAAVVETYALALLYSERVAEAHRFIRKHIPFLSKYVSLHQLQARIAHANNDPFNAYLSEAEYYYQLGKLSSALRLLKMADKYAADIYSIEVARAKEKMIQDELLWRKQQS